MALAAGDGLRRAGIRAVLTGGACANLYSGGAYESVDADFVLISRRGHQLAVALSDHVSGGVRWPGSRRVATRFASRSSSSSVTRA